MYDCNITRIYKYKYNGQELQEELGLNMTAMDFRQYDSAIGRFVIMDMMAEEAHSLSPYRFGFNNPVLFSDPTGLWEETAGGYTTNDANDIAQFMSAFRRHSDKKDDKKKLDIFVAGKRDKGDAVDDSRSNVVKTEKVLNAVFGYSSLRNIDLPTSNGNSDWNDLALSLESLSNEGYGFNSFIISSHGGYNEPSFKIGVDDVTPTNFSKTGVLSKYFKGSSVYILACHLGGGAKPGVASDFVQGLSNLWGATVYANRSWGIPLEFGKPLHTNYFDAWRTNKYQYGGARENAVKFRGEYLKASPGNKTPTIINSLKLNLSTAGQNIFNTHR